MIQSNKYTLDRFEGDKVVFLLRDNEAKEVILPRDQLPQTFQKGDIVALQLKPDGKVHKAILLKEETLAAKEKASSLLQKILKKNQ